MKKNLLYDMAGFFCVYLLLRNVFYDGRKFGYP